MNLGMKT